MPSAPYIFFLYERVIRKKISENEYLASVASVWLGLCMFKDLSMLRIVEAPCLKFFQRGIWLAFEISSVGILSRGEVDFHKISCEMVG